MCRAGGRRCPAHSDPVKIAERNAVRREQAARMKNSPLSDAQYSHRVNYAYEAIARHVADGKETHKTLAVETASGELNWTPERAKLHDEIVQEFLAGWENIPSNGEALFTGGLGGAGKSTVLGKHAGVNTNNYAVVNPDDVKEVMAAKGMVPSIPGLSPMEASPLVHEEASHITKVLSRALLAKRKNLIYDVTMTSYDSTKRKLNELSKYNYTVEAIFVDIPAEVSIRRSQFRHRTGTDDLITRGEGNGGRMLPLDIMKSQADANPLGVFHRLNSEGAFLSSSVWDNSVDGRAPVRVQ